jgi:hypothetical protein
MNEAQGPDATVTADAQLPALDGAQVAALGGTSGGWSGKARTRDELPVGPGLSYGGGAQAGRSRFVRRVAQRLRKILIQNRGIVITSVPFPLFG